MEATMSVTQMRGGQKGLPKTYFDLIERVGSKGTYQKTLFFIFALNWFIAGFIVMQPVFLFLDKPFDCEGKGVLTNDCSKTVCSLPTMKEWEDMQDKTANIKSLSTEFGPYICEEHYKATISKMMEYVGIFMGYLVFLYFTDNYGRKMSLLLTWTVTTIGIGLLCASVNLYMAVAGLFLAGAGCESAIRITMAVFGEVVDYYVRQQYSVALEIAFGLGGVMVGVLYWVFPNWRLINIIFILIPCVVQELLFIFYFQETPKFLLRKGTAHALKAMNRIGRINLKKKNVLTEEDIQNVMLESCEEKEFNLTITPIDIFRFPSLRMKSVCSCLLFALINWLYFGPVFIVDKLGFNPYISQIIVIMSELTAYPISYMVIERMPRNKSGLICFAIVVFFNGILVFANKADNCVECFSNYLEIFCIFSSRFFVAFYFSIFFLYVTELFPLRARGMGFGVGSAAGAIASSSGGVILTAMQSNGIAPTIFFVLCGVLAIAVLLFLPETMNKPLQDEIEEIQDKKNIHKQSRYSSIIESQIKEQ